jgi:hypothetical protein
MNILSLVSQNLDNFYQIQTKCYRNSDTIFFSPIHRTQRGLGAGVATAHCPLSGQRDNDELPRLAHCRDVLPLPWIGAPSYMHASFLAADDRVDRRRAASPRFRPVADDFDHRPSLLVLRVNPVCVVGKRAARPFGDGMMSLS